MPFFGTRHSPNNNCESHKVGATKNTMNAIGVRDGLCGDKMTSIQRNVVSAGYRCPLKLFKGYIKSMHTSP